MAMIDGGLRNGMESLLKYVERMVLCGAVIAAGATIAHTPTLLTNHTVWIFSVYLTIGIGVIAAISSALLYLSDTVELLKKRGHWSLVLFLWLVLYATAVMTVGLTAKFSDLQAKKDAASLLPKLMKDCTSVADCGK